MIIQVPENMQLKYIYAPAISLLKKQTDTYSQDNQEKYIHASGNYSKQDKNFNSEFFLYVRGECPVGEYRTILNCGYKLTFELAQHAQLELDLDLTNYPNNLEVTFKFNLLGPGASVKLISRAILRNQQEIKIITEQNHLAPDTTSDLLLKTICFDQAKWSYNGKIFVSPVGHRTVASQVNHNLLVTSNSHLNLAVSVTSPNLDTLRSSPQAISIPALEVLTNDVKCTHGSAVGQVDRNSLYYLMARGLTAAQAEAVLLESFLGCY